MDGNSNERDTESGLGIYRIGEFIGGAVYLAYLL